MRESDLNYSSPHKGKQAMPLSYKTLSILKSFMHFEFLSMHIVLQLITSLFVRTCIHDDFNGPFGFSMQFIMIISSFFFFSSRNL
jgi:hypothetical protein